MFPNGQFGCMSQISDSRTLERVPFCLLYVLLVLQPEAHRYQNRIVHTNYVFLVYIECHPVTGFLVKKTGGTQANQVFLAAKGFNSKIPKCCNSVEGAVSGSKML